MPRLASQQSDRVFKNAQPREKAYLLADGHGLALRVQPNGSKSWLFRYRRPITRKETFIGLGRYPDVSLAEARVKASRFRNKLYDGIDPGEERITNLKEQRLRSFEAVAAAWLEFKRKGWASETHRKAEYVVNEYLIPKLNGKPIASLGTPDAAAALTFVAASSSNLAEKARQYLGGIIRYAIQQGLREDGRNLSLTGVLAPYAKGHIPAITKESGIGPLAYAIANYESRRHPLRAHSHNAHRSTSWHNRWRSLEGHRPRSCGVAYPRRADENKACSYCAAFYPRPYMHQAQALTLFLGTEQADLVIATGTGSGKTESFLMPIVGTLAIENAERPQSAELPGCRALLLYPMNALVNDQVARIRRLLGDTAVNEIIRGNATRFVPCHQ